MFNKYLLSELLDDSPYHLYMIWLVTGGQKACAQIKPKETRRMMGRWGRTDKGRWSGEVTKQSLMSDRTSGPEEAAAAAAAAAKSLQSCPTLCDPIDSSPPGSSIPGILQARTLEWVAISFSNAWKWNVKVKSLSCVQLLATPWTAAHQAPPSMGFSRQEYWSGVPLSSLTPSSRNQETTKNKRVSLDLGIPRALSRSWE